VVTAVHGRAAHLRNQLEGLARSVVAVDRHVIVAIDDDDVARMAPTNGRTWVMPFVSTTQRLPIAAARNYGAQAAIEDGAELLIFLDVDCIPAPNMVGAYQRAAAEPEHGGGLLCGPVTYLPAAGPQGYDLERLHERTDPHPARPAPSDGDVVVGREYELFWSLSFAVTTPTWRCIGGFCTQYTGYGGEDTDFAQKAAAEAITLRWVGGAHAFHQHHPVSDPPVEHLDDILTNAGIFHRRWGWWPMQGWLDGFAARGLITFDRHGRPRALPRTALDLRDHVGQIRLGPPERTKTTDAAIRG
jgi:N-acetylglucosaminyl-diphospho-decaprenol L-rhamnosyltransferase